MTAASEVLSPVCSAANVISNIGGHIPFIGGAVSVTPPSLELPPLFPQSFSFSCSWLDWRGCVRWDESNNLLMRMSLCSSRGLKILFEEGVERGSFW